MKRLTWGIAFLLFITGHAGHVDAGEFALEKVRNWHHWRGPHANGVALRADPPLTWNEQKNVKWKIAIEGFGNATPIIWKDKLFVLTCIDTGRVDPTRPRSERQPDPLFGITAPQTLHKFDVICLDRNSGQELWRQTAIETVPHEGHHGDNSFASPSPTTDGERLYAWFGSAGCYCYDLAGELVWNRDLGPVETRHSFGEGASPVVHEGRLTIIRDHEGSSSIHVLDAKTGEQIWRADRDEPSAWATPLVVVHGGQTQVITNATNRVRSYNLENGSLLWECGGQVSNVIPSPVAMDDHVLCMSGYRGSALYAISLDARGDVTDTDAVAWSMHRATPYVPSPLLYEGRLYFNQTNEGVLSIVEAASGKQIMQRTRMPGIRRMYASPVAAAGRIYIVGRDGTTLVIAPGAELNVLATNSLDDRIDASPAVVGNEIFLRGKKQLYCIAHR